MAFNVRPGGNAESVEVPDTVKSGDLVRVGELVGIAQINATEGEDGNHYTTLAIEGIAHSPIDETVEAGDALYTDDAGPGLVTLTATATPGGKLVGIATRNKAAAAAGPVWYKLVPNATAVPAA